MKGRLITNGVFSLITLAGWIIAIIGIAQAINDTENLNLERAIDTAIISVGLAYAIIIISGIVNFIMGILSLCSFVDTVVLIIFLVIIELNKAYSKSNAGIITSFIAAYSVSILILIANLVMGIVTLAMPKNKAVEGLTIASGVLAILGGALGANAIVSFIAIHKINKEEKTIDKDKLEPIINSQ